MTKKILVFIRNLVLPIRGRRNKISGGGLSLLGKIQICGNNNTIICLSDKIGDVKIRIYGSNNVLIINKNVVFKKGLIWFEDNNNLIDIGSNTTIEEAELSCAEYGTKIKIGDDCMLSTHIRISTTDSHSIIDKNTGERTNLAGSILIGDHVWIGNGAHINKGVEIGNNSVIASNSVVTKSIPAYTISAGIPAKIKRENIDWLRVRI